MGLEEVDAKPLGIKWLVDSGADVHLMPAHVYERAASAALPLRSTDMVLKAANGGGLKVLGKTKLSLETQDGKVVKLEAVVATDATQCILSASKLRRGGYVIQLREARSVLVREGDVTSLGRGHRGRDLLSLLLAPSEMVSEVAASALVAPVNAAVPLEEGREARDKKEGRHRVDGEGLEELL